MKNKTPFKCLILVFFFIVINSSFVKAEVDIPSSVKSYNGHLYEMCTDWCDWIEAQSRCVARCGHLVTITSAAEQAFVQSIISEACMIGLSDAAIEGTMKWVTDEAVSYTNFAKGEPNNQGNEDYCLMRIDGFWNDGHLDRQDWAYVCEWESLDDYKNGYSSKSIQNAIITLSKTKYKYNGKAKTPSVTATYDGKELTSSDYSVEYKNNIYAGTATVSIVGKGEYQGTVEKKFTIVAGEKIPITFNGNGGTSAKAKINVSVGAKYGTLPTAKRKGYQFMGWFTAKKGGKQITKSSYVKTNKKQTLYAKWKKKIYTITYSLNGGTNSKNNPKTYTVSTKTFSFANPTRKGYVFKGWYSDSKFKKSIKKVVKGSTGNKTLYAKWTAITYNIKFNGNGSTSGSMSQMKEILFGKSVLLKKNTYKKNGYIFMGWSTSKGGNIKYSDGQTISNLASTQGKTINLYAVWKKNSVKEETKATIYGCVIAGCNDSINGYTKEGAIDFYNKLLANKIDGYTVSSRTVKKHIVKDNAPSRENLNTWIANDFDSAKEDDLSFVYYCGHGRGNGGNKPGLGICLKDNDYESYYTYSDFLDYLGQHIKGRIVLVVDACFSGGFVKAAEKNINVQNRICVMASSLDTQPTDSYIKIAMDLQWNHFLQEVSAVVGAVKDVITKENHQYHCFTYALMEGVNWNKKKDFPADNNKDHVVTCYELKQYINNNMPNVTTEIPRFYLGRLVNQPIFGW